MNEIVKLYKENPVRIIEKDGELWFVAKDVVNAEGKIYGENNVTGETVELAPKALCSMNMWGFTPDYFEKSGKIFTSAIFLETVCID